MELEEDLLTYTAVGLAKYGQLKLNKYLVTIMVCRHDVINKNINNNRSTSAQCAKIEIIKALINITRP